MGAKQDCRTCRHNSYLDIPGCAFVSCSHPATLAKTPSWVAGDPAWVNMLTGDLPVSRIDEVGECSCWVAALKSEEA